MRWSRKWSLSARILAVNLFALAALAGGVVYLDSFRNRLVEQRRAELVMQAQIAAAVIADEIAAGQVDDARAQLASVGRLTGARIRLFDAGGAQRIDSWQQTGATFTLRDPSREPLRKSVARALDRGIDWIASNPGLPAYAESAVTRRSDWPEAIAAAHGTAGSQLRRAPDRTLIISAASPVPGAGTIHPVVHVTADARSITRVVRDERSSSFLLFLGVLALSLLLSSFLARTIVRPLRMLSLAAQRVRLGRAREVVVPRFVRRRDEIGQLARALADMTQALRQRIDATETFAADVAHELKNPLASLRSAVDVLGTVSDPRLRAQLLSVVRDDVDRLDRLIIDIAEASRLDAELSRTRFERVDIGAMLATLIDIYEQRGLPRGVRVAYARPEQRSAIALGDEARLAQVIRNLVDNAISFSPDGGLVTVRVTASRRQVIVGVDDEGPGIPPENLEDIFRRFYSERPTAEDFGKHSGLGLAIAKAIVDAHDGRIVAQNRTEAGRIAGARFTVTLPEA